MPQCTCFPFCVENRRQQQSLWAAKNSLFYRAQHGFTRPMKALSSVLRSVVCLFLSVLVRSGFSDSISMREPAAGGCEHPNHAGDLPPLFGNNGFALSLFLTNRFTVDEVIGRTIIIHDHPDDFTTQPSGNSGTKIACGVIRRNGSS